MPTPLPTPTPPYPCPNPDLTPQVSELSTVVEELYDSIDFTHIGCDDRTGKLSPTPTPNP